MGISSEAAAGVCLGSMLVLLGADGASTAWLVGADGASTARRGIAFALGEREREPTSVP